MAIAYYCVMVAIILPIVLSLISRKDMSAADNARPRAYTAALEGYQKRADHAHLNSFEQLPGFIGAVIISDICLADPLWIDGLAVLYVVSRIAYAVAYIGGYPTLRSILFAVGFIAIMGLFVIAI